MLTSAWRAASFPPGRATLEALSRRPTGEMAQQNYGADFSTIFRFLFPSFSTNGLLTWIGCSSPSMLMMKLTSWRFSSAAGSAGGGGAGAAGWKLSFDRFNKLVATTRQVAGEQRRRRPGVSVSADSFGARASILN